MVTTSSPPQRETPDSPGVLSESSPPDRLAGQPLQRERSVTARALLLGVLLSASLAWLNCWVATVYNVHFLGGVQMRFGSVFVLLILVLAVQLPLR